ncbi:MAG: argininosuccinate lyase [Bacteroidetes bacterium]|nr:MAG: argininosuccinate lyase [Bacteroidota bacterium]
MKLWKKEDALDRRIEAFTTGRDPEFDLDLARYDVLGSIAHVRMLGRVGLLTPAEADRLEAGLRQLLREIAVGDFRIEAGVEDVHSQVELLLTRRLGEVGKKLHTGRSRNDQVLLDLRLFFRDQIHALSEKSARLSRLLLALADRYKDVLMPGYTHTQVAMVSSFGLWLAAFGESLIDDLHHWHAAWRIANQNPLGSAAGYGSSFPLDRRHTTRLLGFDDLAWNAMHAQMGRGKTELAMAFALSATAATCNKLASDIILFSNAHFGFVRLPEAFTTGSSIMPHKKNPDVLELVRAHTNRLQSLPAQVSMLTTNLISGYHRDFQLLKEVLWPALDSMHQVFDMLLHVLPQMEVTEGLLDDARYELLFTVEAVNERVRQGVPFRDAYHEVARQVQQGTFRRPPRLAHTHEGSIGNLCLDQIARKLDALWQQFGFEKVEQAMEALERGGSAGKA